MPDYVEVDTLPQSAVLCATYRAKVDTKTYR